MKLGIYFSLLIFLIGCSETDRGNSSSTEDSSDRAAFSAIADLCSDNSYICFKGTISDSSSPVITDKKMRKRRELVISSLEGIAQLTVTAKLCLENCTGIPTSSVEGNSLNPGTVVEIAASKLRERGDRQDVLLVAYLRKSQLATVTVSSTPRGNQLSALESSDMWIRELTGKYRNRYFQDTIEKINGRPTWQRRLREHLFPARSLGGGFLFECKGAGCQPQPCPTGTISSTLIPDYHQTPSYYRACLPDLYFNQLSVVSVPRWFQGYDYVPVEPRCPSGFISLFDLIDNHDDETRQRTQLIGGPHPIAKHLVCGKPNSLHRTPNSSYPDIGVSAIVEDVTSITESRMARVVYFADSQTTDEYRVIPLDRKIRLRIVVRNNGGQAVNSWLLFNLKRENREDFYRAPMRTWSTQLHFGKSEQPTAEQLRFGRMDSPGEYSSLAEPPSQDLTSHPLLSGESASHIFELRIPSGVRTFRIEFDGYTGSHGVDSNPLNDALIINL